MVFIVWMISLFGKEVVKKHQIIQKLVGLITTLLREFHIFIYKAVGEFLHKMDYPFHG